MDATDPRRQLADRGANGPGAAFRINLDDIRDGPTRRGRRSDRTSEPSA